MAVNGIPFYNPYTKEGYDAGQVAMDSCGGHLDSKGRYHYQVIPKCLYDQNATDQFLGVAMDGYPIYGPKDANGSLLTSDDLDICHGRLENGTYVYRITFDFPYILGCYHGYTHTKTSGRCLVATKKNPALEGLWKRKQPMKMGDNASWLMKAWKDAKKKKKLGKHKRKMHKAVYHKWLKELPVDLNSKKYNRMKNKIKKLLLKRNRIP